MSDEDDDGVVNRSVRNPDELNIFKRSAAFDYNIPVVFNMVERDLERYGDCHRHMMQYMLRKEGSTMVKQFNVEIIRFYICHMKKRNPETVSYVKVDKEALKHFNKKVVKQINKHIKWMKLRLEVVRREEDGVEYLTLCNSHSYQSDLLAVSGFKADEVYLFNKWLDEIFAEDGDGSITIGRAMDIAADMPNKISPSKIQEMIDRLEDCNFIRTTNGRIELEPRAIGELEAVLRAKYQPAVCELCNRIIVQTNIAIYCRNYEHCEVKMHIHCFSAYVDRLDGARDVGCPGKDKGCKEVYNKEDIDLLANNRPNRVRNDSHPSGADPEPDEGSDAERVEEEEAEERPQKKRRRGRRQTSESDASDRGEAMDDD